MQVPKEAQAALTLYGGINRFNEPNYRWVWGGDRLSWIYGEWHDYDSTGVLLRKVTEARMRPRYDEKKERFHLERWFAPETYGDPAAWDEVLGPFPSRGDYEHLWCCEDKDGSFFWPTQELSILLVRNNLANRERTAGEVRKQVRRRREIAEREKNERLQSVHESHVAAFPFTSWAPVTGPLPSPVPSA